MATLACTAISAGSGYAANSPGLVNVGCWLPSYASEQRVYRVCVWQVLWTMTLVAGQDDQRHEIPGNRREQGS